MVKPKQHWWSHFPIKEVFAALTFLGGLYIHYQAGQNGMREMMYEIKGDIKELKVRVNYLENKGKPVSEERSEERTKWEMQLAVIPETKLKIK